MFVCIRDRGSEDTCVIAYMCVSVCIDIITTEMYASKRRLNSDSNLTENSQVRSLHSGRVKKKRKTYTRVRRAGVLMSYIYVYLICHIYIYK